MAFETVSQMVTKRKALSSARDCNGIIKSSLKSTIADKAKATIVSIFNEYTKTCLLSGYQLPPPRANGMSGMMKKGHGCSILQHKKPLLKYIKKHGDNSKPTKVHQKVKKRVSFGPSTIKIFSELDYFIGEKAYLKEKAKSELCRNIKRALRNQSKKPEEIVTGRRSSFHSANQQLKIQSKKPNRKLKRLVKSNASVSSSPSKISNGSLTPASTYSKASSSNKLICACPNEPHNICHSSPRKDSNRTPLNGLTQVHPNGLRDVCNTMQSMDSKPTPLNGLIRPRNIVSHTSPSKDSKKTSSNGSNTAPPNGPRNLRYTSVSKDSKKRLSDKLSPTTPNKLRDLRHTSSSKDSKKTPSNSFIPTFPNGFHCLRSTQCSKDSRTTPTNRPNPAPPNGPRDLRHTSASKDSKKSPSNNSTPACLNGSHDLRSTRFRKDSKPPPAKRPIPSKISKKGHTDIDIKTTNKLQVYIKRLVSEKPVPLRVLSRRQGRVCKIVQKYPSKPVINVKKHIDNSASASQLNTEPSLKVKKQAKISEQITPKQLIQKRSLRSIQKRTLRPIQKKTEKTIHKKPGRPIQKKPGRPIQKKPGRPKQKKPGRPKHKKLGRPKQKKPGRPKLKKPGRPKQKKPGRPKQKKPGRPKQKKLGRPKLKNDKLSKCTEKEILSVRVNIKTITNLEKAPNGLTKLPKIYCNGSLKNCKNSQASVLKQRGEIEKLLKTCVLTYKMKKNNNNWTPHQRKMYLKNYTLLKKLKENLLSS